LYFTATAIPGFYPTLQTWRKRNMATKAQVSQRGRAKDWLLMTNDRESVINRLCVSEDRVGGKSPISFIVSG